MQNLNEQESLHFFRKNPKLNSRIVYDDQTLKNINFSLKKTTNFMFLSVILYGIFAVFTFFILFQNLTKKVWFQAILLGRKISRIALFCQFLRIFTIFKETSLLRDDPKSSEMNEIMVSACIQDTNLV